MMTSSSGVIWETVRCAGGGHATGPGLARTRIGSFLRRVHILVLADLWPNGIKLRWYRHQPEDDLRERGQQGRLAGLAGLVPAAGAFGLALVAAARASWHEVAVEGDLEGQVGGELVKPVRGKSFRGR